VPWARLCQSFGPEFSNELLSRDTGLERVRVADRPTTLLITTRNSLHPTMYRNRVNWVLTGEGNPRWRLRRESGDNNGAMSRDAFDFGPYDRGEAGAVPWAVCEAHRELLADSRRLAGRGDHHFGQCDESQTFDCTERDRTAGQLAPGLYFGTVRVGTTATQTMALPNGGPGAVTISAVTSSDPRFVVSGLTLPTTVPAGGIAAVTVAFSPTSSVPYTASISVTSNAVAGSQVFLVSGSGASHSVSLSWRASTSSSLVPGTAWRDTSVVAGQRYYYVVTAVDSSGKESGYSNEASDLVPRRK